MNFIVGIVCLIGVLTSLLGLYGVHVSSVQTVVIGVDDEEGKIMNLMNKIANFIMMIGMLSSSALWGFLFYMAITNSRLIIK